MSVLVMNQQVRALTALEVPTLYPRAWLLTLLPVSVLVLADLSAGTARPLVWAARYLPALLALAPVAWAHSVTTPRSLRLRKELRLLAPTLLILLPASSLQLLADAPLPSLGLQVLLAVGLVLSAIITVLVPLAGWSGEQQLGTLAESMASPRAASITFEKVALAAYFIAVSALSLVSSSGDGAEAVLGVSAVAVAVGPTWFFLLRAQAPAVAASFFVPALVLAVPSALFPFQSSREAMALMAAYALVMLALLPRSIRAGPARPARSVMVEPVRFGHWRMRWPKWVGIEHQSLHIGWATVVAMPLGYGLMYAISNQVMREGLFSLPLLLGVFVCVIGPSIALVENQQLVLQALVAHPRVSVFRAKLVSTLLLTCVGGLALPLALGALSTVPSAGMTVFFVVLGLPALGRSGWRQRVVGIT